MTSTSSDAASRVVRGDTADGAVTHGPAAADLRAGVWTRLGTGAVLGDQTTEASLAALAERTRRAAHAQGYAKGWAEGQRAARAAAAERETLAEQEDGRRRQAVDREREQALTAFEEAVARVREGFDRAAEQLADHVVTMAVEIASAVIGREVAAAEDPGRDALRRALALVPTGACVTVRMHPADRALVDGAAWPDHAVSFLDDPSLARGEAVAETDQIVVDATVSAALARVRKALEP